MSIAVAIIYNYLTIRQAVLIEYTGALIVVTLIVTLVWVGLESHFDWLGVMVCTHQTQSNFFHTAQLYTKTKQRPGDANTQTR